MFTNTPNDFSILRQESLAKEKFSRDAIQKEVCVVAKGLAFSIDVTSSNIDFHNARLFGKLYYDSDDEDFKPIELPKSDPLTYKVFIATTGDRATIECRIYVLTSQHENALFRVKIGAHVGAQTVELFSEPIRVLSKPSQIQKEKRKRAGTVTTAPETPMIPSTPLIPSTPAPPKKTAVFDSAVLDALHRMEQQQREQKQLIEQLLYSKTGVEVAPPVAPSTPTDADDSFENAFVKFLNAWNAVPVGDRPSKMRKVLTTAPDHTTTVSNFVQVCSTPESGIVTKPLALSQLLEDFTAPIEPITSKEEETWDSLYAGYTWSPDSDTRE